MLNRFVASLTPPIATASLLPHAGERRRALRVDLPFPVMVRGVDVTGERFEMTGFLDNLSACGLYLRLPRSIERGATLFLVVRLSTAGTPEAPAPRVALRARVLRSEHLPDGRCGLAMAFDRHRFLYTASA